METVLLAFAGWLDAVGMRQWASATPWVYPAANVLHIVGVVLVIGGIGVVDLRVAGLWRRIPLVTLSRALTPIAVAGLVVQASSGLVLFAADGESLAGSATFRLKLLLIALALANAVAFRAAWRRRPNKLGFVSLPIARLSAVLSILLWFSVAAAGRLIAYT